MFDDTKKELKELEGELLAAEQSQDAAMLGEDFETLFNEIKADLGSQNDEPTIRNYANGYGKYHAPVAHRPAPAPVYAPAPAPEPRKKRHPVLGFIIFLESAALVAMLGFWALHLLG